MVLAERLAAGYGDDDLFVIGWREELESVTDRLIRITTALAVMAVAGSRRRHLVPARVRAGAPRTGSLAWPPGCCRSRWTG